MRNSGEKNMKKLFIRILPTVFILIGCIGVFGGMDENAIAIVIGGGLFMTLGIVIYVINRNIV